MLQLTADEKAILNSKIGSSGDNMALNIVVKAAEMLGASRLVDITSSHIDGCLYHGDSGVLFCETLAKNGAKTKVPTTTNVGALNLIKTKFQILKSAGIGHEIMLQCLFHLQWVPNPHICKMGKLKPCSC